MTEEDANLIGEGLEFASQLETWAMPDKGLIVRKLCALAAASAGAKEKVLKDRGSC